MDENEFIEGSNDVLLSEEEDIENEDAEHFGYEVKRPSVLAYVPMIITIAAYLIYISVAGHPVPDSAKVWLVFGIGFSSCFLVFSLPPIKQNEAYHDFADKRTLSACCSIPNSCDVTSNTPFFVVGLAGLIIQQSPEIAYTTTWEKMCWDIFWFGIMAVSFGSGYYHWAPDSKRLVWDRLPMTVGFMSLFSIVIQETVGPANYVGEMMLPFFLFIGIFSVWWWNQYNDLRLYILVQFFPVLSIIFFLLVFGPSNPAYDNQWYFYLTFAAYMVAKFTEYADHGIYRLTGGFVSGHTIKHLSAGVAIAFVLMMVAGRL